MNDEPNTKAMILLTPGKDDPDSFILYREGSAVPPFVFYMKEAINLAEELAKHTKGPGDHTRVLIPNIDKPKKITRPTRL